MNEILQLFHANQLLEPNKSAHIQITLIGTTHDVESKGDMTAQELEELIKLIHHAQLDVLLKSKL